MCTIHLKSWGDIFSPLPLVISLFVMPLLLCSPTAQLLKGHKDVCSILEHLYISHANAGLCVAWLSWVWLCAVCVCVWLCVCVCVCTCACWSPFDMQRSSSWDHLGLILHNTLQIRLEQFNYPESASNKAIKLVICTGQEWQGFSLINLCLLDS